MYKLNIISGPNRGSSYAINDGENSIGRQTGNAVVLSSQKVSKRHCVLVVNNGEVEVRDQGSSNGTFVNGVLTKSKKVKAGDRISAGEFVLELVKPSNEHIAPPALMGMGGLGGDHGDLRGIPANVLQFPSGDPQARQQQRSSRSSGSGGLTGVNIAEGAKPTGPPKELPAKILWFFDTKIMPNFYAMLLKREWRLVCMSIFGFFMAVSVVSAVYPLLEAARGMVIKETQRRALFMARQIVERNSAAMAARAETKTDLGSIDRADGVSLAVLVDLNNRIIAPAGRMNDYLTTGREANFAVAAAKRFIDGTREGGVVREFPGDMVIAVEPLMVLNPQIGKNVPVAMAVVSLDASIAVLDVGEMGVIYSQAFIIVGLIGALVMLILYKLTLRPFQVLNEDMDKVLKGDMHQVTREFKFEEMGPLWDIIGSALQRVSRDQVNGAGGGAGGLDLTAEDFAGPIRAIGKVSKNGMVICDGDRRVMFLNEVFQEVSGIRADGAIGQELTTVARDQGFVAFANDVFDRAPVGGEGVSEDYDFSGMAYRVYVSAFGTPGTPAKCFVMTAVKNE